MSGRVGEEKKREELEGLRGTRGGSCDFNLDCSGHARGNGGNICGAYTTHRTVDGSNIRSDNGEGSLLERNEASEEALK